MAWSGFDNCFRPQTGREITWFHPSMLEYRGFCLSHSIVTFVIAYFVNKHCFSSLVLLSIDGESGGIVMLLSWICNEVTLLPPAKLTEPSNILTVNTRRRVYRKVISRRKVGNSFALCATYYGWWTWEWDQVGSLGGLTFFMPRYWRLFEVAVPRLCSSAVPVQGINSCNMYTAHVPVEYNMSFGNCRKSQKHYRNRNQDGRHSLVVYLDALLIRIFGWGL